MILAPNTFIGATEITEIVGCSKSRAYRFIRQMNEELEAKGYLVFPGRIPYRYFLERFGLVEEQKDAKADRSAAGDAGSADTAGRKHRRSSNRFNVEAS